jgi:hypothetical protein
VKLGGDSIREQLERDVLAAANPVLVNALDLSNHGTAGSGKVASMLTTAREIPGIALRGANAANCLDVQVTMRERLHLGRTVMITSEFTRAKRNFSSGFELLSFHK